MLPYEGPCCDYGYPLVPQMAVHRSERIEDFAFFRPVGQVITENFGGDEVYKIPVAASMQRR